MKGRSCEIVVYRLRGLFSCQPNDLSATDDSLLSSFH